MYIYCNIPYNTPTSIESVGCACIPTYRHTCTYNSVCMLTIQYIRDKVIF